MITLWKPTRLPKSGSETRWLVRKLPAHQLQLGEQAHTAYVWTVTRVLVYSNGFVVASEPIRMYSLRHAHQAARNACAAYYRKWPKR